MDNQLLEVKDNELLNTDISYQVLVTESQTVVVLDDSKSLITSTPVYELLEIGIQGPPGPPGSGGGTGTFEPVNDIDYSNVVYSYVGYPSKIVRIDYSVSPPLALSYSVVNYATDWANRQTLGYS